MAKPKTSTKDFVLRAFQVTLGLLVLMTALHALGLFTLVGLGLYVPSAASIVVGVVLLVVDFA